MINVTGVMLTLFIVTAAVRGAETNQGMQASVISDFEQQAAKQAQKIIIVSQLYSPEGIRKNRASINGSESLIETKALIDGLKKLSKKRDPQYINQFTDFILHHSLSPINQIFPPVSYLRKLTLLNAMQSAGYVSEKKYLKHLALIECYQQAVDHKTLPDGIVLEAINKGVDPRSLLISLQDKATPFWCQIVQIVHPGWLVGLAKQMLQQEFKSRSIPEMVFKNYVAALKKNPFVFGYANLLLASIKVNNVTATQILIEAEADVNAETSDGQTLLHIAAREGYAAQIQLLLDAGAAIKKDTSNRTPADLVKKNPACLQLFK